MSSAAAVQEVVGATEAPLTLWLNAGVGVVSRGGPAFSQQSDRSDVAGSAGAGIAVEPGLASALASI
jgi:hypothetical protein